MVQVGASGGCRLYGAPCGGTAAGERRRTLFGSPTPAVRETITLTRAHSFARTHARTNETKSISRLRGLRLFPSTSDIVTFLILAISYLAGKVFQNAQEMKINISRF